MLVRKNRNLLSLVSHTARIWFANRLALPSQFGQNSHLWFEPGRCSVFSILGVEWPLCWLDTYLSPDQRHSLRLRYRGPARRTRHPGGPKVPVRPDNDLDYTRPIKVACCSLLSPRFTSPGIFSFHLSHKRWADFAGSCVQLIRFRIQGLSVSRNLCRQYYWTDVARGFLPINVSGTREKFQLIRIHF